MIVIGEWRSVAESRRRPQCTPSVITDHESRPFVWPVRVYHEDMDGSGRRLSRQLLKFLERARTEWLRAAGFEQTDLAARHDVVFVVRSLAIDYARPASFNDELTVTVELTELKAGQILLAQRVARGNEELARASVRHRLCQHGLVQAR